LPGKRREEEEDVERARARAEAVAEEEEVKERVVVEAADDVEKPRRDLLLKERARPVLLRMLIPLLASRTLDPRSSQHHNLFQFCQANRTQLRINHKQYRFQSLSWRRTSKTHPRLSRSRRPPNEIKFVEDSLLNAHI